MKAPSTMRNFNCSFETLSSLFASIKKDVMDDLEKGFLSLRRLSGCSGYKEAELAIFNHLKENVHPGWFQFEDLVFKTCLAFNDQGFLDIQLQTADQERDHIGSKKMPLYIVHDLQTDTRYYVTIKYGDTGLSAIANIISFSDPADIISEISHREVEFAAKQRPQSITEAIAIGVVALHKTLK